MLELGCEDYTYLDQAVKNIERGLYSLLVDSIEAPKLEMSFDEPDAIMSLVKGSYT